LYDLWVTIHVRYRYTLKDLFQAGYHELGLLVKTGISPLNVKIATNSAAEALNIDVGCNRSWKASRYDYT